MFQDLTAPDALAESRLFTDNIPRIVEVFGCQSRRLEREAQWWKSEAKRLRKDLDNAAKDCADKCVENIELRKDIARMEDALEAERKQNEALLARYARLAAAQPAITGPSPRLAMTTTVRAPIFTLPPRLQKRFPHLFLWAPFIQQHYRYSSSHHEQCYMSVYENFLRKYHCLNIK